MGIKRVSPEEARELMDRQGYAYVDVRSIPEFEAGHPEGAYNVPLLHMGAGGRMLPNPDFLGVIESRFAKDAAVVLGCRSGGRSFQAAMVLAASGFTNVIDQRAGFEGAVGPGGSEAGWRARGLPVSTKPAPERTYDSLRAKAR